MMNDEDTEAKSAQEFSSMLYGDSRDNSSSSDGDHQSDDDKKPSYADYFESGNAVAEQPK